MKSSHTTYSVLGFFVPLVFFVGLLYVAVEYSATYALLGASGPALFKIYRLLMQVPPIRAFVGRTLRTKSDALVRAEKTQHFFSGLTIFYFLLISPFVAVVLFAIWFYLSQLF